MRKMAFLLLFSALLPSFLIAKTAEDDRRIEQEKRDDLHSTEAPLYKEEATSSPHPAPSIDLEYFQKLLTKKHASYSDACQVLVIVMGAQIQLKDFPSQFTFLKDRGVIPKDYLQNFHPDKPLKKGLAAYMFCRALRIKGGLWLRIFGASQRYCLKELVFENIMRDGNEQDTVSGEELIVILTRAAEYAAKSR